MLIEFPLVAALAGGALIGLASALLMLANGRIAGISGILAGLVTPHRYEFGWRLVFTLGLVGGGGLMLRLAPASIGFDIDRSLPAMVAGGLLVGFGTRLGSGCTSGHGVCGLSRLSSRSLASVLTFIGAGVVTATVVRTLFGGSL